MSAKNALKKDDASPAERKGIIPATDIETSAQTPVESPPTPNDVALQIRQLINSLRDEEKEELFNTMDKQDF
ncbi:hypothetical protein M0805_007708 [Coniferiporia weirii]|nr:hypothetical protein M0805_007708 [Coniferiporia weirii]